MTIADILAAWVRWMHRNDLTADLVTVQAMAEAMIVNAIMQKDPDLADVLAVAPTAYLHAGLVYLHELAMDDAGMQREADMFQKAIADYSMRWSLTNSDAIPTLYGGQLAP